MKQHTTTKARILELEVPEHITEDLFYHPSGQMIDGWSEPNDFGQRIYWSLPDLPPGNWTILGIAKDLNEEQCREIVDVDQTVSYWEDPNDEFYIDYSGVSCFSDPRDSFASLNIDPNSLVLFEPIK